MLQKKADSRAGEEEHIFVRPSLNLFPAPSQPHPSYATPSVAIQVNPPQSHFSASPLRKLHNYIPRKERQGNVIFSPWPLFLRPAALRPLPLRFHFPAIHPSGSFIFREYAFLRAAGGRWSSWSRCTWDSASGNELPRCKQRGIECHSVLDTESSPFLWIPASAGMTTNTASRGELTLSDSKSNRFGEVTVMVKVISAEPVGNYKLRIVLSDGRTGTFDVTPYIDRGVFCDGKSGPFSPGQRTFLRLIRPFRSKRIPSARRSRRCRQAPSPRDRLLTSPL